MAAGSCCRNMTTSVSLRVLDFAPRSGFNVHSATSSSLICLALIPMYLTAAFPEVPLPAALDLYTAVDLSGERPILTPALLLRWIRDYQ